MVTGSLESNAHMLGGQQRPSDFLFYRNSHSSDECKSFVETIGEAGVTLNHGVFVRSCFGIEFYCQRLEGEASSTFLRPQAVF